MKGILSARESLLQRGVNPGTIALQCGLAGLTFGFLFQITHNVGFLPVRAVAAGLRTHSAVRAPAAACACPLQRCFCSCVFSSALCGGVSHSLQAEQVKHCSVLCCAGV